MAMRANGLTATAGRAGPSRAWPTPSELPEQLNAVAERRQPVLGQLERGATAVDDGAVALGGHPLPPEAGVDVAEDRPAAAPFERQVVSGVGLDVEERNNC